MVFNTGAALLDAIVLAVVSREEEGTYGYKITQDVRKAALAFDPALRAAVCRKIVPGGVTTTGLGMTEGTDGIIK